MNMVGPEPAGASQVRAGAGGAPDPLGWWIAASPLLPLALDAPLALAGAELPASVGRLLALAASAALVVADKRRLLAADPALAGRLPATAWFLLPPAYLWKRAALLGLGRGQVWANLGAYALVALVAVALTVAAAVSMEAARDVPAPARTQAPAQAPAPAQPAAPVPAPAQAAAPAPAQPAAPTLPGCGDRVIADTVLRIISDTAVAREAGVTAVHLSGQREVAQGPGQAGPYRACAGQVLTSEDEEVAADYIVELRGGDVIVHVQVRDGQ